MSRFLCCCCSADEDDERRPLLQASPPDLNGSASARQTRSAHNDAQAERRIGRLEMRRVGVPELDQRFFNMAETFNEQFEHYEAMVRHIKNVRQVYGCDHSDALTLAECVGRMRDEHASQFCISLKTKGYDFLLDVTPLKSAGESEEEPLPLHLKLAQGEIKAVSESAKATISMGTTLQEMIGWLIRTQGPMAEQVKTDATTFQEQGRLSGNLEENMNEVRRAKEMSLEYRKQAGEVFTEVAQIAGTIV